jgi:hypothetical protein
MLHESGAKTDGRGRLPHSTLLVAYDEYGQSGCLVTRETPAENCVNLGVKGGVFVPSILAEERLGDHIGVGFCNPTACLSVILF